MAMTESGKSHFVPLLALRTLSALLFIVALLLLSSCSGSGKEGEVQVAAAASMSDAVKELAAAYKKRHPQTTVRLTIASSGTLAAQIIKGAPVDVFISASRRQVRRIMDSGIETGNPRILCSNALVLAVPEGTPVEGRSGLAVLDLPHIGSIGMGDPEYVPAGHYAAAVLRGAGRSTNLGGTTVYGSSVRQVLAWLTSGEVDAAFIYATDAALVDDLMLAGRWDTVNGEKIRYPVLPLTEADSNEEAERFAAFLSSSHAGEILTRYGFTPVGSSEEGGAP